MKLLTYLAETTHRHPWLKLAWAAGVIGIISLSILPGETMPQVGLWDKAQHAIAYGVVAGLGFWAASGRQHRLWVLGGLFLLGALLELAQLYVPGRQGSVEDIFANSVGLAVASLAWQLVSWATAARK